MTCRYQSTSRKNSCSVTASPREARTRPSSPQKLKPEEKKLQRTRKLRTEERHMRRKKNKAKIEESNKRQTYYREKGWI